MMNPKTAASVAPIVTALLEPADAEVGSATTTVAAALGDTDVVVCALLHSNREILFRDSISGRLSVPGKLT